MKAYKILMLLASVSLLLALPALTGCDESEPEEEPFDTWKAKLKEKTYYVSGVFLTDPTGFTEIKDVTAEFPGMSIKFDEDGDSFTITNSVVPFWPVSGKLGIPADQKYNVIQNVMRSDGVSHIIYGGDVVLPGTWNTVFQYTAPDQQRTASISGYYRFDWTLQQ